MVDFSLISLAHNIFAIFSNIACHKMHMEIIRINSVLNIWLVFVVLIVVRAQTQYAIGLLLMFISRGPYDLTSTIIFINAQKWQMDE